MITLPGYRIISKIHDGQHSVVYRGWQNYNNQPVIVKMLKDDYPLNADLERFKREYDLISSIRLEGVIKAFGIQKVRNSMVMILEDFGGVALRRTIDRDNIGTADALRLAIQVFEIIGQLHAGQITHNGLNPSNIIWNPETGQVKLIDFCRATRRLKENPELRHPEISDGLWAYISPEQTGRMNSNVDYRTDFYSLGITLYELFSGRLPFQAETAMEWVHAHIAKSPITPVEINPKLPGALSRIILKLLAKTAEERYQSAFGVLADLRACLERELHHGGEADFEIGTHDTPAELQISQKIYGREKEVDALLAAIDRVCLGKKEMVLIAGPSGVGKSALVHEIQRHVLVRETGRKNLRVISGKFDQYMRDIPYMPFIEAFQDLVRRLLTESKDQISFWKRKLLGELGQNGQMIVDVIPEVELIIGPQPKVPELSAEESENRFHLTFLRFVQAFAAQDYPLALFLDDLQWTDTDSLTLIEQLVSDPSEEFIIIIGAYRDNEVDDKHPLINLLQKLAHRDVETRTITVTTLGRADVNQLVADTLGTGLETVVSLSDLCFHKTRGNPFFLKQMLHTLYKDGYLFFDSQSGIWQWDAVQINQVGFADNVVDLMAVKIKKLAPSTQAVIKIAACIGNLFDLRHLSIVTETSREKSLDHLWEALQEGLILPVHGTYPSAREMLDSGAEALFRFLHDRVQQAAYSLIQSDERPAIHLNIGRLMLKHLDTKQVEDHLFEIVNHFNQGSGLIVERTERATLAEINFQAGKKARASAAFQLAFTYQMSALALMEADSWQTRYEFTLALYNEAAEAAYLHTDYEAAERLSGVVLEKARTLLEKVRVYEIMIQASLSQNKMLDALRTALPLLNQLGFKLPERPNRLHVFMEFLNSRRLLIGRKTADLKHLPLIEDPRILAAVSILHRMGSIAYLSASRLYQLNVFKIISISIKYGNTDESVVGYAIYGALICEVWNQVDLAYQYGQLAMDLIERLNVHKYKTRVYWIFNAFIRHRKEPVANSLPSLIESYNIGLEVGDFEFAAYSAHCYIGHLFCITDDLLHVAHEAEKYGKGIARIKQKTVFYWHQLFHQVILNLIGKSDDPCEIKGEQYDENHMVPIHLAANDNHAMFSYHYQKLLLYYTFQKYDQAIEHADLSWKYVSGGLGAIILPLFYFTDSLARLAVYPDVSLIKQKRYYLKVLSNVRCLKKWSRHAPMNHLHKVQLIEAERYRVIGHDREAVRHYDMAIATSRQNGFSQSEALGNELAAKYWLLQGKEDFAQLYMVKAHYRYQLLNMKAKADHLASSYAHLLKPVGADGQKKTDTSPAFYEIQNRSLDIDSVIKASQAISGEIELDKLLDKLMQVAISNAGAKKGFLIINQEGVLTIRARAVSEASPADLTSTQYAAVNMPVQDSHEVPQGIVHYVSRTREDIVLNEATQEGLFIRDTYVRTVRPRSVLCIPIIHQSQLTGVLYLENNIVPNAFTPKQVQVLKLLASQAAIHIENAKLYTRYRSLYDNAVEGIFQTTLDGRFISANPAMATILGYDSPEDLIASVTNVAKQIYINRDDRKTFEFRLNENDRISGYDTQCYRKDGSRIWISLSARGVRDQKKRMLYYEGSIVDISERMEKEQVERKRESAEAASLAKSQFLANMSHEIRTPMNAIIGMTDLALKMDLPPKLKDYLKTVEVASQSLMRLINDILDFSKIEAGKMEMEAVPFALEAVMTRIMTFLGETAEQKGIELNITIDPNVPKGLVGDPTRLGQVLINLAGNAVKFTQEGRVDIGVRRRDDNTKRIELLFTVEDTGIGIKHSQLERLFNAFTQSDESTARRYGGTGLGLAICKQLVEMMDGHIWVRSYPGQGTIFQFNAKFDKAAESIPLEPFDLSSRNFKERTLQVETEVRALLGDKQLLIVEDNRINQKVALEILDTVGIAAEVAESGAEALSVLSRKSFDAILMDVQMPEMDGYETTQKIRALPQHRDLPIIAMTAHAMKGDKKRCIDAGMNDYVGKPLEPYILFESLLKWLKPNKIIKIKPSLEASFEHALNIPQPVDIPGIDTATFFRRHKGKTRLLYELLADFHDYHSHTADDIRSALECHDLDMAYHLAHTLKGLAGNLAAIELQEKAAAFEQRLKSDQIEKAAALLDDLTHSVQQLLEAFKKIDKEQIPGRTEIDEKYFREPANSSVGPQKIVDQLFVSLEKHNPIESETHLATLKNVLVNTSYAADYDLIGRFLSNFDFQNAKQALIKLTEKIASQKPSKAS